MDLHGTFRTRSRQREVRVLVLTFCDWGKHRSVLTGTLYAWMLHRGMLPGFELLCRHRRDLLWMPGRWRLDKDHKIHCNECDDVDDENGPMKFVSQSHRHGPIHAVPFCSSIPFSRCCALFKSQPHAFLPAMRFLEVPQKSKMDRVLNI